MLRTSAWLRRVISRSTSRVIQPQNKQIISIFHKKNANVYRPKQNTSCSAYRMLSTTADKSPNLLSEEERKQFESDFHSTPNDDLIEEELQDGPADIALSRGKELEESGRLEEALKEYLFAASIDPANIIPHYTAGILYYKLRNYQEAFTHFKRACEINPRVVEVHNNLGQCALKLNRMAEALEYMQQAVKLSPSNVVAHLNLANAYNELHKYGLANKHFLKAIELSPQEPVSLFTYAQSLRQQAKYERAISFYKLAAKYSPKETEAIGKLVELCVKEMTNNMNASKDEEPVK